MRRQNSGKIFLFQLVFLLNKCEFFSEFYLAVLANFISLVFTSERPHYSLALFSSFICTCKFSKKIEFASKKDPRLSLRNMLITG